MGCIKQVFGCLGMIFGLLSTIVVLALLLLG
jgi:hypothetical protein